MDNVTFLSSLKNYFVKAFDYKGRTSRREYWYVQTALLLINIALFAFFFVPTLSVLLMAGPSRLPYYSSDYLNSTLSNVSLIQFISLIFGVLSLSLLKRRLNDVGVDSFLSWTLVGLQVFSLIASFFPFVVAILIFSPVMMTILVGWSLVLGALTFVLTLRPSKVRHYNIVGL